MFRVKSLVLMGSGDIKTSEYYFVDRRR